MNLTINVINQDNSVLSADNITINSSTTSATSTATETVDDDSYVEVSIDNVGYFTYKNTFRVYDEDLTIEIKLVQQINDIQNANYRRPYPYLTLIQDPCSFKVDVYNTSSYTGNVAYYVNNELYNQGFENFSIDFFKVGLYQIKQENIVYELDSSTILFKKYYANTEEDTLSADVSTNLTVEEYRPTLSLRVNNATDSDTLECIDLYDEIEVFTDWSLPNDNVYTLIYEVSDPLGNIIDLDTSTFSLVSVTPADTSITFSPYRLGAYTIKAIITDTTCGNTFTVSRTVETCDFFFIEYTDCNTFTVHNRSASINVSYYIADLKNQIIKDDKVINTESTEEVTIDDQGVFNLYYTYQNTLGETVSQVIPIYNICDIESCFVNRIFNFMCPDCGCTTDGFDKQYEYLKMSSLYRTLLMKINKNVYINRVYDALSDTDLDELTEMDEIIERLDKFCSFINCKGSKNSKSKDCGCS